ncbi:hypothetical protein KM043_002488 [Ampulex compressa]|nr:hypothetical protein KM043_002488 [Ampulex compressa]
MASMMGLQQQAASQDTVDYAGYLQSSHGQIQIAQKPQSKDHNASFTSTKGLLNGPGQNNCFLNSAVQERVFGVRKGVGRTFANIRNGREIEAVTSSVPPAPTPLTSEFKVPSASSTARNAPFHSHRGA